ncbi:MAG TPA: RNA-binding S4 domain-containing protein [Caulobacteraceae bacterium]|nr:RNA-binding S4 domain-containing protein [Caulobacteraceae bacterium]
MSEAVDGCRLDVWLWRARFFKTRALAGRFLEGGKLRVIRPGGEPTRVDKPSRLIRPGDRLMFALGGRLIEVEITALGERRGPAQEARTLYADDGRPYPGPRHQPVEQDAS